MDRNQKTGFVTLIGKTNVGKSTLLNKIIDQKISITSRKPQTTRHRLLGIKTKDTSQAIFVDTPGYHIGQKRALNKHMNKVALGSMEGVDLILFVIEATRWAQEEEELFSRLKFHKDKLLIVINKIDKLKSKNELLPFIEFLRLETGLDKIIPISALKSNLNTLESEIFEFLPIGKHLYPADQVADTTLRFMASEIIREKCITRVGDEIPYRLTCMIDDFIEEEIIHINATIFVEKESQKGILIGESGNRLKSIGIAARKDLEKLLSKKVMLKLWVKVKKDWTDNQALLSSMGYKGD
ncbi:MAG: GTPase Era [Pseudomonadota bacterium]|jgi:GTP-binding protein Era|nr:GTPase Era [Gammaproteobacteria bacterium]MEC7917568.1 GTPase Era [Pseudomonadota bacterium]|tara:strand:- start:2042 stop:2932 length:891 start_codon:yes stop_codon:yes gene_type:complete